jgi:hypothetical protein
VVVFVAVSAVAVWFRVYRVRLGVDSIEMVYMVLGFLSSVALILTLVAACRYIRWAESTGVDGGYISYQGCVAECNSRQNSVDAFFHRFCTETYTDPRLVNWAIWDEDYNMLVDGGGPGVCDPGFYCSQCASKADEFDNMLRLAQFLRVKTYLSWLAFCLVMVGSQPLVWVIGAVFHASFWITASVFFGMVHNMAGAINQLDKGYSSMGSELVFPSLIDMCATCIALDVVLFLALAWLLTNAGKKRVISVEGSVNTGGKLSGMSSVRIEPRYSRVCVSLS